MTKLKAPLFGLGAVGRLAKSLAFRHSRGQNIAETSPDPPDTKSLAQLSWRHMYLKAVALWHALSPAEKQDWESLARRRHMTGFAWFMSQALKPNPGLYLPLQGGTMTGDIDMAKHRILKLPLPTDNQEAASKVYVDTAIPPGGYTEGARVYHSADQVTPNNTLTTLAFNSERFDTDTIHDPVTNNSRLTCKTAGKYIIIFLLVFQANNTGWRAAHIKHNNLTYPGTIILTATQADQTLIQTSSIWNMSVNDYVEAVAKQNSGGNLNAVAQPAQGCEFMMQRIG